MSKNKRRCCYSKAAIAVLSTGIRKPCQLFYDTLDRIEKHSKDFSWSSQRWTRRTTAGVVSNEPMNQSRAATSGIRTPKAASMHKRRCSSRCVCASSSQSPTTNKKTIRGVPWSRC